MLVKRPLGLTLYPFMVAKRPLGLTLYPLCSSNSLTAYLVARLYPLWSINALLGSHCALYARQTACWAHAVAFMLVKRCLGLTLYPLWSLNASWAHAVPFILAERPHRVTSWPDCTYRGCSLFGASECLSALVIGPSDFKVLVGGHDAALSGEYGRGNNHPSYLCLMPCA